MHRCSGQGWAWLGQILASFDLGRGWIRSRPSGDQREKTDAVPTHAHAQQRDGFPGTEAAAADLSPRLRRCINRRASTTHVTHSSQAHLLATRPRHEATLAQSRLGSISRLRSGVVGLQVWRITSLAAALQGWDTLHRLSHFVVARVMPEFWTGWVSSCVHRLISHQQPLHAAPYASSRRPCAGPGL